jgi:hypothetical protein
MEFLMSVLGWFVGLVGILAGIAVILAPFFVRVVTVQEATAVAFKYMGRFAYCAMEFGGYHFDPADGSIVSGSGPRSYGYCWCIWRVGGWVFYVRPFVKPAKYADCNDPDKFGEGMCVHLGDITPEPSVSSAETADPENVGLNVKFVATMRVVSPYHWLFSSPKDVTSQVVKRLGAVLRAWIKNHKQEHVQEAHGNGVQLWSDLIALDCKPVFDKIEAEWGLRILENSIIVEDVEYDPEYQVALKASGQADLLAKAEAAKLSGPLKIMMAEWIAGEVANWPEGTPVPQVVAELKASGAYARKEAAFETLRVQGLAGNNFVREERTIDITSGGQAIEDPDFKGIAVIAGAIGAAASQVRGGGRRSNRGRGGSSRPASSKLPEDMEGEELEEWAERFKKNRGREREED